MKIEKMKLVLNPEEKSIAYDATIEASGYCPTNSDENTTPKAYLLMERSFQAMASEMVRNVLGAEIEAAFADVEFEYTNFTGLCGIEYEDENYNDVIRYEEDGYTQVDLLLDLYGITHKVDLVKLATFGQTDLVAI